MMRKSHRKKPLTDGVAAQTASAIPSYDDAAASANSAVIECLRRMLTTGFESRTFLLSGPQGIGKTTLALSIAQALVCKRLTNGAVCGSCDDCAAFSVRRHPDISIIDAVDDRISIDSIRGLTRSFSRRPILSKRHIAIVDRSERMTEEAANAFLKSLEEPAGDTVYILTTDAIDLLPKTIVSRCVVIHLAPSSVNDLVDSLVKQGIDKQRARKLAVFTCGRSADAIYLSTHPSAFEDAAKDASMIVDMLSAPTHDRIAFAESVAESKETVTQVTGTLERWEAVLYRMLGASAGITDRGPDAERLTAIAKRPGFSKYIIRTIDALLDLKKRIRSSGNIRLNLESFILHLPSVRT